MQNHFECNSVPLASKQASTALSIIITLRFCNDDKDARCNMLLPGIQWSVNPRRAGRKSVDDRSIDNSALFSRLGSDGTFSVSAVTKWFRAIIAIRPPTGPSEDLRSILQIVCGATDDYDNDTFARIATYNNDIDTGLVFRPTPHSIDSRCCG